MSKAVFKYVKYKCVKEEIKKKIIHYRKSNPFQNLPCSGTGPSLVPGWPGWSYRKFLSWEEGCQPLVTYRNLTFLPLFFPSFFPHLFYKILNRKGQYSWKRHFTLKNGFYPCFPSASLCRLFPTSHPSALIRNPAVLGIVSRFLFRGKNMD